MRRWIALVVTAVAAITVLVRTPTGIRAPAAEAGTANLVRAARGKLAAGPAGRTLQRVTTSPADESNPAISPNGRLLLTTSDEHDAGSKRALLRLDLVGGGAPAVLAADVQAWSPAFMPDGASFVLVRALGDSIAEGSELVRFGVLPPLSPIATLLSGKRTFDHPSVSPDGKTVAFTPAERGQLDGTEVHVVAIDGSAERRLAPGRSPAWSPDGRWIALIRTDQDGHDHIVVIDAHSGADARIVTSGESFDSEPAWSRDGQRIAYASRQIDATQDSDPRVASDLWISRADGSGRVQLTEGAAVLGSTAWGADGWIYFVSDDAGNRDIWRVRPAE